MADEYELNPLGSCNEADIGNFNLKFDNKFSILNINICSMNKNFSGLLSFLARLKSKVSIIVVTESWLDDDTVNTYNIEGYCSAHINRGGRERGGGIIIYYLSHLNIKINTEYTGIYNTHESVYFTVSDLLNNRKINVMSVYRPPSRDVNEFNNFILNMSANNKLRNCVLVGDFNINLNIVNENNVNFVETMFENDFLNTIDLPTRYSYAGNPSIIDHTWTNLNLNYTAYVFGCPIADHMPTLTIFEVKTKNIKTNITFRDFSFDNKNIFLNNIASEKLQFINSIRNLNDPNYVSEKIQSWLLHLVDKYFPTKTKHISKKRLDMPWLTDDIIACIDNKHKLFIALKERRITYAVFSFYCKSLKILLNIVEKRYHRKQC